MTLGADGRIVRSVAGLAPGSVLVTRFADGTAVSDVRQLDSPSAATRVPPAHEGNRSTNETSDPGEAVVPVHQLSYTEASRELDAIVGFFEQREVDVDQLVVRLERATAIVDELDRRVRRTRAQVEELVPRLEAVNRHPVDDDEGDDIDELDDTAPRLGDDEADGDEQALF